MTRRTLRDLRPHIEARRDRATSDKRWQPAAGAAVLPEETRYFAIADGMMLDSRNVQVGHRHWHVPPLRLCRANAWLLAPGRRLPAYLGTMQYCVETDVKDGVPVPALFVQPTAEDFARPAAEFQIPVGGLRRQTIDLMFLPEDDSSCACVLSVRRVTPPRATSTSLWPEVSCSQTRFTPEATSSPGLILLIFASSSARLSSISRKVPGCRRLLLLCMPS
jgi:hypothetical protein